METASHVPELYDSKVPDQIIGHLHGSAQQMAKRLTREEGLYVESVPRRHLRSVEIATTTPEGTLVASAPMPVTVTKARNLGGRHETAQQLLDQIHRISRLGTKRSLRA